MAVARAKELISTLLVVVDVFLDFGGRKLRFYNPSVLFVALRYIKGSKKQRFASFVAVLATLGIAIGVCALIVVSSIMQGLQERLKANILNDCAHVVVRADNKNLPELLGLPHVIGAVPFAQGEAMLQAGSDITMVTLQGTDTNNLYVRPDYAVNVGLSSRRGGPRVSDLSSAYNTTNGGAAAVDPSTLVVDNTKVNEEVHIAIGNGSDTLDEEVLLCIQMPRVDRSGYNYGSLFPFSAGSYELAINYQMLMQLGLSSSSDAKVRLISTQNARYTPFGLTPVQRNFRVTDIINSMDKSAAPTVIGNYSDVRRFLRLPPSETYFRLFLEDPFLVDEVTTLLEGKYAYSDWRERYGDFFKAVGLEKITMSIMLCLIIVVAAFNILSSLTMVVSSRVSEIAILKTIGMTNRALLEVFLIVGMSASLIGSFIGLVAGIPLALNAQSILNALGISIVQGELPIQIDSVNIILIVLLCLVVSLLCTFYPAYYASKADPAKHLMAAS